MPISRTKNNQYRISCKPDSGFWMVWKLANQLAEDTHNCLFSLVPRFVGSGSYIVFTGGFCSALPLGPMNSLGRGSKGEFLVSLSSKRPLCSQTLWPVIKINRMCRSKLGFPLKKWTHRNSPSLSWIDVFWSSSKQTETNTKFQHFYQLASRLSYLGAWKKNARNKCVWDVSAAVNRSSDQTMYNEKICGKPLKCFLSVKPTMDNLMSDE